MPSFGQSGLKVNLADGSLDLDGDEKILLVDFDVQQSFGHPAGDSGAWVMHPVINGGEIGVTGGIAVTAQLGDGVTFDLATASASLTDASDVAVGTPVVLTDADANGTFEARFDWHAHDRSRFAAHRDRFLGWNGDRRVYGSGRELTAGG